MSVILIEIKENTTHYHVKDWLCMRMTVQLSLLVLASGWLKEILTIILKNSAFSRNSNDGSSFECGKRQLNSKIEWKQLKNWRKNYLFLMMTSEKHCSLIETIVLKWKTKDSLTLDQAWRLKALLTLEVYNRRNEKLFKRRSKTFLRNAEIMLETV